MHELALAQNIIELLEEQAINHQFSQVKQVWLEIGVMACVEVSSLRFGLEVVCRNTIADKAVFHIVIQPSKGWCLSCSRSFTTSVHSSGCPYCQSRKIQTENTSGMCIREIEVD